MTERCPKIIVFIDAVPYELARELGGDWNVGPVHPGAGFSLNLFPAMFAGTSPDDLGAFNNWTPSLGSGGPSAMAKGGRRLLDRLTRRPQLLSRATHKLHRKALGGPNTANIPWAYLPYFGRSQEPEGLPWIYGGEDWDVYGVGGSPSVALERDQDVLRAASAALRPGRSLFVKLVSLDWIGHKTGPNSPAFSERAKVLTEDTLRLVDAFDAANGHASMAFLCSDHGMVDVTRLERAQLEGRFGRPGPDSYLYFLESTMVRVWSGQTERLAEIAGYLEGRFEGRVLSPGERTELGLTNPAFGDLIFVLDAGGVFWPGWYGGFVPRGMHGYLSHKPDLHTAFAAVRASGGCEWGEDLPRTSLQVFDYLQDAE